MKRDGGDLSKKLSIITLFILITIIAVYVVLNWEDFERIKQIEKKYFLNQSILSLLMICVNGYITKIFLASFGLKLKPKEWFGIGGMAIKGIYLKRRLEFPYSKFASTVAASYILAFLSAGVLGIASLLFIRRLHGIMQWELFTFFLTVTAIMMVILAFSPTIDEPQNRFTRILKSALDGWSTIKKNKALIAKITILAILNYIIISFRLGYGYKMLSINVAILPVFLMALLMGFTILIAITPGNLGIQETAIGFISKLMGTGFNEGLMVAGILRIVGMTIVFVLGPIFMYGLMKGDKSNQIP